MLEIILAAVPALAKTLFQGKGAEVIDAGVKVAKEVFGTDDSNEIVKKMETDPTLAEQFKVKLQAETAALQNEARMYELQVEDTKNARETFGGSFNWSQFSLGSFVSVGFIAVLILLIVRPVSLGADMLTALTILLGWLGNAFGQVVNYHFGSSAGSAQKDGVIGQLKQSILKKM